MTSEKLIEMKYVGPGTKPTNIFVQESEVQSLENTKVWKVNKRKKVSSNG